MWGELGVKVASFPEQYFGLFDKGYKGNASIVQQYLRVNSQHRHSCFENLDNHQLKRTNPEGFLAKKEAYH